MLIKLIVGLPGSGKTHYLNNLDDSWFKIDDPMNRPVNDIIPKNADKLAIADPSFCMERILESCVKILEKKYSNTQIDVVYFENDIEKCRKNVILRNDGRIVKEFIEVLSKFYNPPSDAMKIYDGE